MTVDKEIIGSEMQPLSAKLVIVQGVVQNLPEIIDALKRVYALNKKEQRFERILQSRLDELNVNQGNFKVLVEGLTDLSKSEGADAETKAMYRDMIRTLFEFFTSDTHRSQDFSKYLEDF